MCMACPLRLCRSCVSDETVSFDARPDATLSDSESPAQDEVSEGPEETWEIESCSDCESATCGSASEELLKASDLRENMDEKPVESQHGCPLLIYLRHLHRSGDRDYVRDGLKYQRTLAQLYETDNTYHGHGYIFGSLLPHVYFMEHRGIPWQVIPVNVLLSKAWMNMFGFPSLREQAEVLIRAYDTPTPYDKMLKTLLFEMLHRVEHTEKDTRHLMRKHFVALDDKLQFEFNTLELLSKFESATKIRQFEGVYRQEGPMDFLLTLTLNQSLTPFTAG